MVDPARSKETDPVHVEEGDSSPREATHAGIDREVLYKRILGVAAGLLVLLSVSAVVSALLYRKLFLGLVAEDPPPPPLAEAREPVLPPPPNLQRDPAADMAAFRAQENALLQRYGWTDQEGAVLHIPVERAIELTAKHGARAALSDPEAPAAGAPETGGGP